VTLKLRPPEAVRQMGREADWYYASTLHCEKHPYIHGYFVSGFAYFNETGSVYYTVRMYQ